MADAPAPIVLAFPLGTNNRERETALPEGAVRHCNNLDVTRQGGVLCRRGLRLTHAGAWHSLFTHPSQRFLVGVQDGMLSRVESSPVALAAVAGSVVYAIQNDDLYWTDGQRVGQITATGTVGTWGLPTPPVPLTAAVAYGGLHAGTYQVAMTAVVDTGLESGCAETVSVEVPEGGGIQVTAPAATGVTFAFYRTPANGGAEELRQATTVAPGATVVVGGGLLGKRLESLHAVAPLPGQHLLAHKGRLWGATGNVVWFTSEKSPHWVFPATGYYPFESPVTMLGAAEDGIFVGLYDRVYSLQGGDPAQMTQRAVSSVGAVAGSGAEIPYDLFLGQGSFPSRQWAWWDTDGFLCVGKPGGIVVRPTREQYSAGSSAQGFMAYRRHEGMRQLVAGMKGEATAALVATDTSALDVFSNGVVLNA